MKKQIRLLNGVLIIALNLFFYLAHAQAPFIQWQKCIGGSKDDYVNYMIKLADGDFLLCGSTNSTDGDFDASQGNHDAVLMKVDEAGNILWQKTYGGSKFDEFQDAIETTSGDLIVLGDTYSNDGQVSGNHGSAGNRDIWLVKTNSEGTLISQHCYGGKGDEYAEKLIMTTEGNIAFVGGTSSNDGQVLNNHGDYDGWLVKLKRSGDIDFSVTIGDTAFDVCAGVSEVNGGLIVSGTSSTLDYAVPHKEEHYNSFAARVDASGNIIYWKYYGGDNDAEDVNDQIEASDGNVILAGHISSPAIDSIGNYGLNPMIWKINATTGNIIWSRFISSYPDTSVVFSICNMSDGGYAVVGPFGHASDFRSYDDYAARLDSNGNVVWSAHYGGGKFDALFAVAQEDDGSILVTGATRSNNKDVSGNHGGYEDIWLADLSANEEKISQRDESSLFQLTITPNPVSNATVISFSLLQSKKISFKIFDVEGRLIRMLSNETMSAGNHEFTWEARDEKGYGVSEGIYFLQIQSAGFSQTEKLMVTR